MFLSLILSVINMTDQVLSLSYFWCHESIMHDFFCQYLILQIMFCYVSVTYLHNVITGMQQE